MDPALLPVLLLVIAMAIRAFNSPGKRERREGLLVDESAELIFDCVRLERYKDVYDILPAKADINMAIRKPGIQANTRKHFQKYYDRELSFSRMRRAFINIRKQQPEEFWNQATIAGFAQLDTVEEAKGIICEVVILLNYDGSMYRLNSGWLIKMDDWWMSMRLPHWQKDVLT